MASNAPGQSTQTAYRLGPSLSLDRRGAPIFSFGELVLLRIPEQILVEGYVENEATAPLERIFHLFLQLDQAALSISHSSARWTSSQIGLEVYPVLSFTSTGGALSTYNRMSDTAAKAALLPLLPLSSRHPTPDVFGEPLDFGN